MTVYKCLMAFQLTHNGRTLIEMQEGEVKPLSELDNASISQLIHDGLIEVSNG